MKHPAKYIGPFDVSNVMGMCWLTDEFVWKFQSDNSPRIYTVSFTDIRYVF